MDHITTTGVVLLPAGFALVLAIATAAAAWQLLLDRLEDRAVARANTDLGLPAVDDITALADAVGVIRDLPAGERAADIQAMDEACDLDDANIAAAIDAWRAAQ